VGAYFDSLQGTLNHIFTADAFGCTE